VRYYEQKQRLHLSNINNCIYIIEGENENDFVAKEIQTSSYSNSGSGISKSNFDKLSTIEGACITAQLEGFVLVKTLNIMKTADYLLSFTQRLCQRYV
jgi:hypothetical protein